jgi:TonB family protein
MNKGADAPLFFPVIESDHTVLHIRSSQILALLLSVAAHITIGCYLYDGGNYQRIRYRTISLDLVKVTRENRVAPPPGLVEPESATPVSLAVKDAAPTPATMTSEPVDTGNTDPYYVRSDVLNEQPSVLLDISADLPLSAPNGPIQKMAVLELLINEYGEVDRVVVESSSFSEADQDLIVQAFKKAKFKPGRVNGVPVKSRLRIETSVPPPLEVLTPR